MAIPSRNDVALHAVALARSDRRDVHHALEHVVPLRADDRRRRDPDRDGLQAKLHEARYDRVRGNHARLARLNAAGACIRALAADARMLASLSGSLLRIYVCAEEARMPRPRRRDLAL